MPVPSFLRDLRRVAGWHRRLLAGAFAAASVALGLEALEPSPPPSVRILAAATDLPAGATLSPADLTTSALSPEAVPAGAFHPGDPVSGRVLAAPLRAGEPLTDVRLVGTALLRTYGQDTVAAPVRIADADAVRLLSPGDRVDVLAAAGTSWGRQSDPVLTPAVTVAHAVPVLTVAGRRGGGMSDGALVVLATSPTVAEQLAGAAVSARLSVVVRSASD